jgi:DNA-binding NarL/FixJ family response regulator
MTGDSNGMTRILVVDDHQLVRAGLVSLLDGEDDLEVVGEAADGAEALEVAVATAPDVVLMDLSMPIMDGVSATRALLDERPETAVVVLTSFADQARVAEALAAGAVGYLLKDSHPRDLLAGIRAAASGYAPLDPRVARGLLPSGRAPDPAAQLSQRELQVLQLVTKGMANKQIGRALGISEHTVKVHLGSVFRQIGVGDRTSAAMWARKHLPDDPASL